MASIAVQSATSLAGDTCDDKTSDRTLLARFAHNRDEAAFEQLVRRHQTLVLGVCRRHLRHEEDVEDAFQATFLVLAAKADKVRWQASIANWLYGVALRIARKAAGRRGKRQRRERTDMETVAQAELCEVADHHAAQILDEELSRLPEKYRAPLVLCCLEGRSRREAAEQLGLSEQAVKGRLERGRKKLRVRLMVRGVSLAVAVAALGASQAPASAAGSTLVASTVASAVAFTAGQAGVSVPSSVASLANGELIMTGTSLLRGLFLAIVTVCAVGFAAWLSAGPAVAGRAPLKIGLPSELTQAGDGATFFTAAGDMQTAEEASAELAGVWLFESVMDSGRRPPLTESALYFIGNRVVLQKDGDRINVGELTLDPTNTPKQFDIHDSRLGRTMPGIYELNDGVLRICLNEDPQGNPGRPTKFVSEQGTPNDLLMTLRRRPDNPSKEAKALQGVWDATRVWSDGEELPRDKAEPMQALVAGDALIVVESDGSVELLRFKLNASASPQQIDLEEAGKRVLGIYRLEGDELRIKMGAKGASRRPEEFTAEKGDHSRVLELRRVKPGG